MRILSYIVPKELQGNDFIRSLHRQYKSKGELTKRQTWALRDMLDIDEDFYDWDFVCKIPGVSGNYDDIMTKLKRNKFRATKGRNKCIRALQSIVDGKVDNHLIAEALGKGFNHRRYWR